MDNTGDDPLLDRMMCETIVISGARQAGILNLALGGIDLEERTVRLDEPFDKSSTSRFPTGSHAACTTSRAPAAPSARTSLTDEKRTPLRRLGSGADSIRGQFSPVVDTRQAGGT